MAVKAQIHAGGRGKGKFKEASAGDKGGVRIAKSVAEVKEFAKQMLGATLVTVQTGPDGRAVNRIYVSDGIDIERELYLSALVDRSTSRVAFIASQAGGMDIEEVAATTPEKIISVSIDPASGYMPFHGRRIAFALGLKGKQISACVKLIGDLYNLMLAKDMSLLEINPLVVTKEGQLICLDAKVSFDSNALYRHADIVGLRDLSEEDAKEVEASKYDLNYVKLDGNIGCMVNGAGLAMATMDIIKLYGAREFPRRRRWRHQGEGDGGVQDHPRRSQGERHPRQHLRRHHALRRHRRGRRCRGARDGHHSSAGVRLEGTNVELGKKILAESGLKIVAGRRSGRTIR